MIRSRLSALAIATLLVAVSPATPAEVHAASIQFDLPASNGLRAQVETFNGEVTLEFRRKGRLVSYEVQGEATEAGLKAQFGALGQIDVAYQPTKTRTEKPPKKCEGPPTTWGEGFFIGTIEFVGEHEYVRVETGQAKGTMSISRESAWRCPSHARPMRLWEMAQPAASHPRRQAKDSGGPATLAVSSRRCQCFFNAYSIPGRRNGRTSFTAARMESREGMTITRATFVDAGASAFAFDHTAGTAKVRPPQPFNGYGAFQRRPHGHDLWMSTIEVPLLGADPLSIDRHHYRARLVRALPGD
ncbi:MAG TPA: hypothetical protein VFI03_07405 [Solirubrobacterales bacterium]|nr:hypothetical protein [Solirubrobacterales bacterium]